MVQTNSEWWDAAKLLKYVDSQEEMNHYNDELDKFSIYRTFNMWHP